MSTTSEPGTGHLAGLDAAVSMEHAITLAAKPHAFAGAVLCPNHARDLLLTPSVCMGTGSSLAEQTFRKTAVPYTAWITEAWKGLGWAEPSAALFWEMATMYHTLYLASRHAAENVTDPSSIPPILSCGSTSSMGSSNTHHTDRPMAFDKKKYSTAASAKELPVWLVATFLLLHCEDMAYNRNLSGVDGRKLHGNLAMTPDPLLKHTGNVDFTSLFKHPSLSPRSGLYAGWNNDNSHCTAYILRHLRKFLLLSAVSDNPDAAHACMHLASLPEEDSKSKQRTTSAYNRYSADEIRQEHDKEHGNVGLGVRLTMDGMERMHLWLQLPSGGGVDDPPVNIGEFLWNSLYSTPPPPTATLSIIEVEREIRRHLELELLMAGVDHDDKEDVSTDEEESSLVAMSQLSLQDTSKSDDKGERAKQPVQGYQKELSYMHMRGTTILLKPNQQDTSSGASATSGDQPYFGGSASAGRLHDLSIFGCSDVHMYLLQPFEHVTIASCTGCTIVVGAVAGLLHVVDCEKTTITSAARRIVISNSADTVIYTFTPSPPILVGDNRNCQFAPYNTYYEGLREDLLATGLAAAAVAENQSPLHAKSVDGETTPWPPLQCASNKWKLPIEISKLEMPVEPSSTAGPTGSGSQLSSSQGTSPGADDKAPKMGSVGDNSVQAPVLLPVSEFHILFVPLITEAARLRRTAVEGNDESKTGDTEKAPESQYCRILAEVLQMSPFRLPLEYERRALVKADRMRGIQEAVRKNLTAEQQMQFEEELNRGFREWLVTSGNLQQVLDLVHLEKRGGV